MACELSHEKPLRAHVNTGKDAVRNVTIPQSKISKKSSNTSLDASQSSCMNRWLRLCRRFGFFRLRGAGLRLLPLYRVAVGGNRSRSAGSNAFNIFSSLSGAPQFEHANSLRAIRPSTNAARVPQ